MKKLFLLAMVLGLLLCGCATIPAKTYEETVSGWTSYKDVAKWMDENFTFDQSRLPQVWENNFRSVRPARVTFKLKSGIHFDGARFVKETLNLINPAYEAQMVYLDNGPQWQSCQGGAWDVVHFVCSFKVDGKLYFMDYATVRRDMVGIFGPFNSLKEYQIFYASWHQGNISASYMTVDKNDCLRGKPYMQKNGLWKDEWNE